MCLSPEPHSKRYKQIKAHIYKQNWKQRTRNSLKMFCLKYFSIHLFSILKAKTQQKQRMNAQPIKPRDTAQVSLLTWCNHRAELYFSQGNIYKHTEYITDVPAPLLYHTTKLALWREYEPDCVPELPQFTLVCHSCGILNTLAMTCPIKYTGAEQYTRTSSYQRTEKYPHAAVLSCLRCNESYAWSSCHLLLLWIQTYLSAFLPERTLSSLQNNKDTATWHAFPTRKPTCWKQVLRCLCILEKLTETLICKWIMIAIYTDNRDTPNILPWSQQLISPG